VVATLVLGASLAAQVPRTEGKTLSQNPLVIADLIKGKPALLIVTFSKNAGENAKEWTKALQAKGINNRCVFYQVAELEDVPRFFRRLVIAAMRKGVPAEKYETFVILITETQVWKKFVGFNNEQDPYLVLIDASGAVQYKLSGEMTDERLKEIAEKLR